MHAHTLTQKRLVRVTLDIMCYDDLDVQSIDWNDTLGLEVMKVLMQISRITQKYFKIKY